MPRKVRTDTSGALFPSTNRGIERRQIFSDQQHREILYFSYIIFALFLVFACSAKEAEPPSRQFFEEHFLSSLQLGSNETQFTEKFESAICVPIPYVNSPYSHWSYSKCSPRPDKPTANYIKIPGTDPVEVAHYEAEFFYEKLESMMFQFFKKDYRRVHNSLEDLLGSPSKKYSKRISGTLGPTVNKNKIAIWKQSDYAIKLQSSPSGGPISVMRFYLHTYPFRLKEPFEKQLKENPAISSYNRKHYENWIRTIESQY